MEIDIDAEAKKWENQRLCVGQYLVTVEDLFEEGQKKLAKELDDAKKMAENMDSASTLPIFTDNSEKFSQGEFSGDSFLDAAFYLIFRDDTAPEDRNYYVEMARQERRRQDAPLHRVKKLYGQIKELDAALRKHYRKTFVFDHSKYSQWANRSAWFQCEANVLLGTFTGRNKPSLSVVFPENGEGDLQFLVDNSFQGKTLAGDFSDSSSGSLYSEGIHGKSLVLPGIFNELGSGDPSSKIASILLLNQGGAEDYFVDLKNQFNIGKHVIEKYLETPALQHLLREKN